MTKHKIKPGDNIEAEPARWRFDGDVPRQFDTHVRRSIPLYDAGHDLIAKLSDYFLSDGSACYELGCSTGQLSRRLAEHNQHKSISFYAIDQIPEMTALTQANCAHDPRIEVITDDILNIDFKPADMLIAYYTVQFIAPKNRQLLIDRIYQSLNWGGAFILFEKVRGADARFQDIATGLYTDYKLDQGYTEAEILGKTRSLKGVLEPFSTQGNLDLLHRAGFTDIMTVMKYVCFEGFLAIK